MTFYLRTKSYTITEDGFMHKHQSALDNQREDDAIKDLQDSGIYPDPLEDIAENDFFSMETDYE